MKHIKKYQNLKYRFGFTLVELLVVISILAILTTIAFLSFGGHSSKARDSVRISTLRNVQKGLAIQYQKAGAYPVPDDYIDIIGVSKQGYIGDSVTRIINISGKTIDPKSDSLYSYSLDQTGKKIQLSGYLEDNSTINISSNLDKFINKAIASGDYSDKFIYTIGDRVGILIDPITKTTINEITTEKTINLNTDTNNYTVVFSNSSTNSGVITGSGNSLLLDIATIQNSCILGNTPVINGGNINAYKTSSVEYNEECSSVIRSCNNSILDGDIAYIYDSCSPKQPLNCTPTIYNGYEIPEINHNTTNPTITKEITGGISDISATCINGVLTYGQENINCSASYVLDNGICQPDICTGSAPDFSVVNGTQKYNTNWIYNNTPGICTFICQAGYYYSSNICNPASIGYIVPTEGLTTQTPCSNNNTFQDTTGQISCKTVQSGYYSTPIGTGPKTSQTQCEANNYCVNGIKTACPVGYSSSAGSTSCTINSYTVSGGFGANAANQVISVCGTNVTADASGNFSTTRTYGSVCNNILATRAGYTCTTTTNGSASLASNINNIAGSCTINSYSVSGSFGANANSATINVCGTNLTATTTGTFSTTRTYGSVCNNITATRAGYTCTTTTNGPASLASNINNIAGSCIFNQNVFTSNGTFIVPAGITTVYVTAIGGGGGGGGGRASGYDVNIAASGGGGGGGYYVQNQAITVIPGQSIAITIGAGGGGGGAGGNGGAGGTTSFGGYLSKAGGGGGTGSAGAYGPYAGGIGGTNGGKSQRGGYVYPCYCEASVNGGSIGSFIGGAVPKSVYCSSVGSNCCYGASGGGGGASIFGNGGNGGSCTGPSTAGVGGAGGSYGAGGGGGGSSYGGYIPGNGGAGKPGYLKITW